ncbi:MAG TPA: hypothetical protein VNL91_03885 [Thermoanaerobaculia bacterium]|nr:hypothetical protein [Thermoanaerobaculia bacterium]
MNSVITITRRGFQRTGGLSPVESWVLAYQVALTLPNALVSIVSEVDGRTIWSNGPVGMAGTDVTRNLQPVG